MFLPQVEWLGTKMTANAREDVEEQTHCLQCELAAIMEDGTEFP